MPPAGLLLNGGGGVGGLVGGSSPPPPQKWCWHFRGTEGREENFLAKTSWR